MSAYIIRNVMPKRFPLFFCYIFYKRIYITENLQITQINSFLSCLCRYNVIDDTVISVIYAWTIVFSSFLMTLIQLTTVKLLYCSEVKEKKIIG